MRLPTLALLWLFLRTCQPRIILSRHRLRRLALHRGGSTGDEGAVSVTVPVDVDGSSTAAAVTEETTIDPEDTCLADIVDASSVQRVLNAIGRIPALRNAVDSHMRITSARPADACLAAAAIHRLATLEGQDGNVSARVLRDRRFEQLMEILECRHESLGAHVIYQVIEGLARLDCYPQDLLVQLERRALVILNGTATGLGSGMETEDRHEAGEQEDEAVTVPPVSSPATPTDVAWLFYAFGYAHVVFKYDAQRVLAATSRALRSQATGLHDLAPSALANIIWAVSATSRPEDQAHKAESFDLVAKLTNALTTKVDTLSMQDAVKTIWSLTCIGYVNVTFMAEVAVCLESRIAAGEGADKDLIQLAWVFAGSRYVPPATWVQTVSQRLGNYTVDRAPQAAAPAAVVPTNPDDELSEDAPASADLALSELAKLAWALAVFKAPDASKFLDAAFGKLLRPGISCPVDSAVALVLAVSLLHTAEPSLSFKWAGALGRLTASIEDKIREVDTTTLIKVGQRDASSPGCSLTPNFP